jgi:pyroglutamyl-peptidase
VAGAEKVRLLVTGFTPFPGAPVNPTEHLIRHFVEYPLTIAAAEFRFAVLPVTYSGAIPALEHAVGDFDPHIAIHFGLAAETPGFRLEKTARNEIAATTPDNDAVSPVPRAICAGSPHHASTLPLAGIAKALRARSLPVMWSEDAGGYLCNYVFYHSAAGLCPGVRAAMAGFVHVGPVAIDGMQGEEGAMNFRKLVEGAEIIIETCICEHRITRR